MSAGLYHLGQFPPRALGWPQPIPLLGPASTAVARYDGTLAAVPNAAVLPSPLTVVLEYAAKRGVGGCACSSGHVHRKPVCGSLFAETEPQSALLPTRAPQRVAQREVVERPL